MNQKPWLWKKRSVEKTIFAVDKVISPSRTIQEEVHKFPTDKDAELERPSKSLNEKLASVLLDCHNGDDTSAKDAQKPQEKMRGEDKAIEEVESLKKETDEDLSKGASKISRDHERIQKELEEKLREKGEKLREKGKRLAELTIENTSLTNALLAKEKSIGELLKSKTKKDAECSTLVDRLDSIEKENAFLRYEFHMLEKELGIRKEEMDYSRQYADASHKQYQEAAQKVSKLEAECQRLRLLLQKKSPGHALMNMKNEVGMVGRETDMRRRTNPSRDLVYNKPAKGNSPEVSDMSIGLVIKRLQDLEEENKALKRILTKKNTELESSRNRYVQTATRLSEAEILLGKLSEDHKSTELSVISKFDIASDDGISSSGSWANALISELEHLRTGEVKSQKNCKAIEVSEMSLLDDFAEMEERAIVSVDTPKRGYCSDLTGRELVPVEQELGFSGRTENSFDWLQIVLNAMLKQKRISKRSLEELCEDIRIALGCINPSKTFCKSDTTQKSMNSNSSSGSNLRKSICRIIELIEGIAPMSLICNDLPDDCLEKNQHSEIPQSPTSKEYFVHIFQWKISDLNPLLHRLIHTCKEVLNGRADLQKFAQEVAFALDWSINNRATPTNSSIARDRIKKHFSCDQSQNGNENADVLSFRPPRVASPDDQRVFFNMKSNQHDLLEENRKLKDDLKNAESEKKNLAAKLLSVTEESQGLMKQLQEAQNSIKGLQSELEKQKESNEITEDQIEKQKLINEDLDTQLTMSQAKLNDIFQKFSSLEVELEDKKNSCEELEATCLELQLQLESIAKKESPTHDRHDVEKIHQTGWEITTASSKLAECQETILNLGKQLKALASSSDIALFDSVLSKTSTMANPTLKKNLVKRSSLRSQMLADNDTKSEILKSSQNEEDETTREVQKPPLLQCDNRDALQDPNIKVNAPETNRTSGHNDRGNAANVLAIVPSKKKGGFSFLRKLLLRRKKGKGKGTESLAKA